jgi:DNA-binding beta-propeller fold protein YncE
MTFRIALLSLLAVLFLSPAAPAWDRGEATTFARLPQSERNPEGIALDKKTGDVYVADFEVRGTADGMGHVVVFNKEGKVRRVLSVQHSSPLLLGLDFHPTTHALLVIDFGGQQVLNVNPMTGASTVFTKLDSAAGPNALTFDKAGNVYISDSFQGVIWKTPPTGTGVLPPASWASSPLLTTTGKPPFGANGMAFNNDFTFMFVANTGNDTILKIPASGAPVTELTNSINGADGLAIDEHDNIWVCANQSDEIVVIDKTGKAIAKLGDFDGIGERGTPRGFLFPASLVFSGEFVLVTNLSLDTTPFGFQTVDTQWTQQVKTHTVAKIKRRIPNLRDRHDDD